MSAITQETLSVSGILLAKTYSRQSAEVERYAQENSHQISLQVRQAMSGQLFFAVIQVFMSAVPAIVYLVSGWLLTAGSSGNFAFGGAGITAGTIVAFTTVQSRLLFPMMGLMRVALDLQTSDRKSTRLNSSHVAISYAVFCLKKKNNSVVSGFTSSLADAVLARPHTVL